MQSIHNFLANKPLYYKEIDHKRVHDAYALLKPHITHPRTVHIVGTNGKGSTGRMLAHLAYKSGMSVGHYSSPHILKFNERIWIDGEDASDEVLESAHQRLFAILGKSISDALSYFEYTTLLDFVVFENCDLMVLEAGLGGEFDATNVCDKELSIITPIGIDHQAFLGESIEEIASTKIRSIQKQVLLAPQVYDEVVEVAKEIANNVGASLVGAHKCNKGLNLEGTHEGHPYEYNNICIPTETVGTRLESIAKEKGWGDYLIDNATVAIKALDILGIKYELNDLKTLELFGRFYALTDNIRIDVGHNPLAARAIEKALDKKVVLIYNSLDDKNYEEVLRMLKPKVKRVEIIPIESQRATTLEEIERALQNVGLEYSYFNNKIEADENYLVFGSFYVVEEFLKQRNM
ncbi:MAG TPA: bifunctional folylpolyglutamate synthase/dihydrofolate synthase [Epsilonproteobacteria bacterium]|nr:bifunctional folylpolyglutamate synthase/dihydrofolate synthase [Campylobacterota bacterium]